MSDKNVEATEKKPAARATRSRQGQSASAKRRREAKKRQMEQAQQQHGGGGGNGAGEREGSDYQTMVRILDRICASERMTYGELGIFGALNWLQQEQNGQHHGQHKTRTAGR